MLVLNGEGRLFLGERLGESGVWQFPQGGVEPGASEEETVVKELHEELGAEEKHFKIIRRLDAVHRYKFKAPKEYRAGIFDGQEQHFWAVRFLGKDADIRLDRFEPEMGDFKWCTIAEVRSLAEPKRLVGYEAPLNEIADLAAK